jgi:hypothetical protein
MFSDLNQDQKDKLTVVQALFNNHFGTSLTDWVCQRAQIANRSTGLVCTLDPELKKDSIVLLQVAFKIMDIPLNVYKESVLRQSSRIVICALPNEGLYINLIVPIKDPYWQQEDRNGFNNTAKRYG